MPEEVKPDPLDGYSTRCPVCEYPTIGERGGFFICPICDWEDDGGDNLDGYGANGDYTMREARQNFRAHHTMYRPNSTGSDIDGWNIHLKRVYMALIDAYRIERITSPRRARVLWKGAEITFPELYRPRCP